MKKVLALVLTLAMALCVFVGCGGSKLTDGTYRAEDAEADKRGWTEFAEIVVENGKIVSANFDSINGEGVLKSQDESYKQSMLGKGGITHPGEFYDALEEQYMQKQDSTKMDTIAGATTSSDNITLLLAEIEAQIKAGKPGTYKVAKVG